MSPVKPTLIIMADFIQAMETWLQF